MFKMITKIGVRSGEIVTLLEEVKGPLTVKEIEVYLGEEKDVILMCIGALIRGGLIEAEDINGSTFYRLFKNT